MLDDIKMEQIHHRKIRKYIEYQTEEGKRQLDEIHPSWKSGEDLSFYRKKEMTFYLKGNMQDIWHGYVSADPSRSWNCKRISLGLLLQKSPENIFYDQDAINGIDTGQVYFLNLHLMLGLLNIPVAFEIIKVDTEKRMIAFSYLEENKSKGVQQIKFTDVDGERVKITHISYYKSDSQFRDKWIYPYFHKKIIRNFHRNMRKLLTSEKPPPTISPGTGQGLSDLGRKPGKQ